MLSNSASTLRRLASGLAAYWPLLLALLFFAALPFRRQMEIPLSLFALSLGVLAFKAELRKEIRTAARFVLPVFLCIWIPMLISCFDSLDPDKSWAQTIPSLRFLAAALAIAVTFRDARSRELLLRLMTWLLLFWAADGYFQLAFGHDVFGIPMNEDRLNALFYTRYQYYGPTLAFLSPLALDYMRRNWRKGAWILGFAFIFGAVLISGMRSAWVMMALVTAAFMLPMLRKREQRRQALMLPAAVVLMLAITVAASPLMKERLQISSLAVVGTQGALDKASSYRIPIFRNALAMYADHPVNGVGARAFGAAYLHYADPDDPHRLDDEDETRAHQAHNILLEFMADTGTIGLLGLLLAAGLGWRYWRSLGPSQRQAAFPYAVALLAILFPFNSHFAFFGVYTLSVTWVLVGLMTAAACGSGNSHERSQVGDRDDGHRQDEEDSNDVLGHGVISES